MTSLAAATGAWLVFEDEAGVSMTPPRARTCGRRSRTPVVRVRGRSRRRVSIAALTCYKAGERSRLISRPRLDDGQGENMAHHLVRTVRRGLRKIQYRPHLIDGCLAETGLIPEPDYRRRESNP